MEQSNQNILFNYKSNNLNKYKKNFIRHAICEIRFPTLLELGEQHPPSSFVKALRKDYPFIDHAQEFSIGPGIAPNAIPNYAHIFRSSKATWTVTLKQSSLSIETHSYQGFDKMKERILQALEAALPVIDSELLTRVGLRYVNLIDQKEDPRLGWINESLTGTMVSGVFFNIMEYNSRLLMSSEDGGCILQHGIEFTNQELRIPGYSIDVDSYKTEVNVRDFEKVIDETHSQVFDVFDWSLGEKAKSFLQQE